MLSYRNFVKTFQELGLNMERRVMLHASLPALGEVKGGAGTVVGSLLASCGAVITPTFTFRSMVIPPHGPADNAMVYDPDLEGQSTPEFFHADMPVDPEMGEIAETLRQHPTAQRSDHPLLSFAGVNVGEALASQSLDDLWAPVKWLADADGDVLLIGVDHTKNVSLHYAEFLVNRKQFIRWALVEGKIVEIPHWPGCSDGFPAIKPLIQGFVLQNKIGNANVELIPLRDLINTATGWIREDPRALLCAREGCEKCEPVRRALGDH
jgi:aminoglycoside 3-N-acetyltransferase